MEDMFSQVRAMMVRLAAGATSREDAADWAMERIKDEEKDYSSDSTVWTALDRLAGADLQQAPGVYLHGSEDFEAWLSDLD